MQSTEGKPGRVFVLRLENGDIIPGCIDEFARANGIQMASVFLIGGIGKGQIVVGPRDSVKLPPEPMLIPLDGAHEIVGVGLIAPDKSGVSRMHMHASLGRAGQTKTGCVRPGIETWHVGEAVIYEILDAKAIRLPDERTGFELLNAGFYKAIQMTNEYPESRQERRDKKRQAAQEKMAKHGMGLAQIYKDAIMKRLNRRKNQPES